MDAKAGVWIDHREAILVRIAEGDAQGAVVRIQSDAESQARRNSDHPAGRFEPLHQTADSTRQRKYTAELSEFYDSVAAQLRGVNSLLILGPGEARQELHSHISGGYQMPSSVSVEAAERMTEPQVVARVREFFSR